MCRLRLVIISLTVSIYSSIKRHFRSLFRYKFQALSFLITCNAIPSNNGMLEALLKYEPLQVLPKTTKQEELPTKQEELSKSMVHALVKQYNLSEVSVNAALLANQRSLDFIQSIISNLLSSLTWISNAVSSIVSYVSKTFFVSILSFVQNVFIGNLLKLFSTLNGFSYLWSMPTIYIPILITYLGLLVADAILYLTINALSSDPDGAWEIASTLFEGFVDFVWSFLPF